MPMSIRLFWWISVIIVAYGVAMAAWALLFPDMQYLSFLAKLPPTLRDQAHDQRIYWIVKDALLWGVPIVAFAWFATFKHSNWARWAFAGLLVINLAVDLLLAKVLVQQLIGAALLHDSTQLDYYFECMARQTWLDPRLYLNSAVLLVATGLVFSRRARVWFARAKSGDGS